MRPTPRPRTIDPAALLEQAGWIRSLVRGLVQEEALAEEIMQDTWVAAIQRRPEPSRSGGLRAWLGVVARNLALRARRRELVRRAVERQASRPEGMPGGQDGVERMQLQERLAGAVLALDEPYRTAVILRHVEGRSNAEVARRQGCSPTAARQRVARGLGQLRARLERELGDRSAWCAALLQLAGGSIESGVLTGGVLMGTKIALAGAGCVLLGTLWWRVGAGGGDDSRPFGHRGVGPVLEPLPSEPRVPESVDGSGSEARLRAPAPGVEREVRLPLVETIAPAYLGRVADARGRALDQATLVRIARPDEEPVRVASDGGFRIPVYGAQSARPIALSVACPGFQRQEVLALPGVFLDIALANLPALMGRLLDPDRLPVHPPGLIRVTVEGATGSSSRELETELAADGSFVLADLPVGHLVRLWARARGFAHRELEPNLELEAGGVAHLDVELPPGAVVTGLVVDALSRQPIPGARVWLETRSWPGVDALTPTGLADGEGRFHLQGAEIERLLGQENEYVHFVLMGMAEGYVLSPARGYASTPSESQVYDFELELRRAAARLHLQAFRPDGRPASGAQIVLIDSEANHAFVTSDRHGVAVFESLPAGRVSLWVDEASATGHIERELAAGEAGRVELTLVPDRARLTGRVSDGEGRPVANLALTLERHLVTSGAALGFEQGETRTDAGGDFAFEGLPTGRFRIRPRPDDNRCVDPGEVVLQIGPEETLRADFVLGGCLRVEGRVETRQAPADSLELELRDLRTGASAAKMRPATDGAFAFEAIFARAYELVLLRDREILDRIPVGPGTATGLRLRAGDR